MPRKIEGLAKRGSQKWIQRVINDTPEFFDSSIRKQLTLPDNEIITWHSPLKNDEYAEYQDEAFLQLLDIELPEVPLKDFWPSRGPVWDALGRTDSGKVFLVEAKAHIPEMLSPGTQAGEKSLEKIRDSLDKTKRYMGSRSGNDWSSTFYQYTNRLAHLYLLRVLNNIPAYLLFVHFINDTDMNGPETEDEWSGAIKELHSHLGIEKNKLSGYVVDVFIDVLKL